MQRESIRVRAIIHGYNFEHVCRESGRGGGVGTYIMSNLKYNILVNSVCHAESLWLNIPIGNRSFIVGIVYRKPNTNIDEFQESLLSVLHQFKIDKRSCVLMGDFNIDVTTGSSNNNSGHLFTSPLQCLGLEQNNYYHSYTCYEILQNSH